MSEHDLTLNPENIEDDFVVDSVLNELAMDTLNFLNDKIGSDSRVPDGQQAYVMWQAMAAVLFNIIMHISETAELEPQELVDKTTENLTEAVASMSGDCCGGDHHHH